MRVCNCTGYLNNPGGRCCRDLALGEAQKERRTQIPPGHIMPVAPLTPEDVRRIIREELERAKG